MAKKTHERFIEELYLINSNIEVLGEYILTKKHILCKCKICENEWYITPDNLLQGKGCPSCANNTKKTHKQFIEDLLKVNPNIEIISEYINTNTKIKCKCRIDNFVWDARASALLKGNGCPSCCMRNKKRKSHEEFINQLKGINSDVKIKDKYINATTKILCHCLICNHEWRVRPNQLLSRHGCPSCNSSKGETNIRKSNATLSAT